jgi:hypothetical protein
MITFIASCLVLGSKYIREPVKLETIEPITVEL